MKGKNTLNHLQILQLLTDQNMKVDIKLWTINCFMLAKQLRHFITNLHITGIFCNNSFICQNCCDVRKSDTILLSITRTPVYLLTSVCPIFSSNEMAYILNYNLLFLKKLKLKCFVFKWPVTISYCF